MHRLSSYSLAIVFVGAFALVPLMVDLVWPAFVAAALLWGAVAVLAYREHARGRGRSRRARRGRS